MSISEDETHFRHSIQKTAVLWDITMCSAVDIYNAHCPIPEYNYLQNNFEI
jgi:hypothetical protein